MDKAYRTFWRRHQLLKQRQKIIAAIREYLCVQDFLEVETPLLVKGTCPDAHIDTIRAEEGYLVTSTEYQIKRLIVEGFEKVFTLTKNFRANERGRYHSCEFTMLEWARVSASLRKIEEDALTFIKNAFCKLYPNQNRLEFNGNEIDLLSQDWERITVRIAFEKYLNLKNLEDFTLKPLLNSCEKARISLPESVQNDECLAISYLLDLLQSHLGKKTPTFLLDWPSYMTTSAPIDSKDPYVAERSELYIGGVEIANGFPFLRDAVLQRKLFLQELQKRKEQGKPEVTMDEKLLSALEQGLPSGAGMALGVDRLVMVLTGSSKLSEVQAFDWDNL